MNSNSSLTHASFVCLMKAIVLDLNSRQSADFWHMRFRNGEDASNVEALHLVRNDGLTLFVYPGYNAKGKLAISYSRPRNAKGEWLEVYEKNIRLLDPSINVDEQKGAGAIVNDVIRRLMPAASSMHALVVERLKAEADYEAGKQGTVAEIAAIFGESQRNQRGIWNIGSYSTDATAIGYGTISVHSRDSVKFELNPGSREEAVKLAAALKALGY